MACVTTCTNCGTLYEESSEESANDPGRLCRRCFDMAGNLFVPSRATTSPYDLDGLKEYPGE